MNCKNGDLAFVVRSYAGNEGKIFQCVRLISAPSWAIETGPRWQVDRPVVSADGSLINSIADACLRPLRDSDGEDEMLQLVGRPVGTPQAA